MGSEVAIRAASLPEKIEYARFLAKSGLLPGPFRQHPENILFAYEYGEMLGLHPIASITAINVIDGKPSISAGLISALVRRAGHKLRVQATGEGDDVRARCQIVRADDPSFTYSATWTMQRAKEADLLGKTNWRRYPIAMLKARAVSECARDACQEVLMGIAYTPDELGGEDDGGEIVHDGFPTQPDGLVDAGQMTEEAREAAGLMNRKQRIEHAQLREMNKVDPADVTITTEPDENDPWDTQPERPKPAPPKSLGVLEDLLKSLQLGPQEDEHAVLTWLGGDPWVASIGQVRQVTGQLKDYIRVAEGDLDAARDAIWEQYRKVHADA